jgi:hypothetical protein
MFIMKYTVVHDEWNKRRKKGVLLGKPTSKEGIAKKTSMSSSGAKEGTQSEGTAKTFEIDKKTSGGIKDIINL